ALAEAALVVRVGGEAGLGPGLRRLLEGVAVVAEAVQAQDDRLWFAVLGRPLGERQLGAVGRDVTVGRQLGHDSLLARRNDRRRTSGQRAGQHDREESRGYYSPPEKEYDCDRAFRNHHRRYRPRRLRRRWRPVGASKSLPQSGQGRTDRMPLLQP